MQLKKNDFFSAFTFYSHTNPPQLYLHLKNLSVDEEANLFLLGAGLTASNDGDKPRLLQPENLIGRGVFRFEGNDIVKCILALERIGCLSLAAKDLFIPFLKQKNTEEFEVLEALKLLAKDKGKKRDSTIDSDQPSNPVAAKKVVTQEQHQSEAISAAKRGDSRLIGILLGNGITSKDQEALKAARIELDSGRSLEFCQEFAREALAYQQENLLAFLEQPVEKQTFTQLQTEFQQAIRDAKEVMVSAKISYYEYRPFVVNCTFDTEEAYETWLQKQFDSYSLIPNVFISLEPDMPLDKLVQLLNEKNIEINGLANKLAEGRQQSFGNFSQFEIVINRKFENHQKLIEEFLNDRDNLPACYSYQTPEEKANLKSALSEAKISINLCDESGNTLLHYALDRKHIDLAILLLQKGADINIKNKTGQLPWEYAGINKSAMILIQSNAAQLNYLESKFLKEAEQILRDYEPKLKSKEADLRSSFWRIFTDEEITTERRRDKSEFDKKHQKAEETKNEEPLATEIERRSTVGRSELHERLLALTESDTKIKKLELDKQGLTQIVSEKVEVIDSQSKEISKLKAAISKQAQDVSLLLQFMQEFKAGQYNTSLASTPLSTSVPLAASPTSFFTTSPQEASSTSSNSIPLPQPTNRSGLGH